MTNLEKLKNIIRGELPRLMLLTDGCIVYTNVKPDTPTVIGRDGFSISSDKVIIDDCAPSESKNKFQKITQVIGVEPMLSDVFDYVNVYYNGRTSESKHERIYNDEQKSKINSFLVGNWDMELPYLKDQHEFVIDRLLELFNVPEMVLFQVEMVYSDGCKSWSYFKSETNEDLILERSIQIVKDEYDKKLERKSWDFFANIDKPRPTILINEHPRKKGGLKFKTKWR